MTALYSPVTEGYEVLFADPFREKARSILASIDVDGPVDPPFDSSNAEADRDSRAYASPAECDRAAGYHYPHNQRMDESGRWSA